MRGTSLRLLFIIWCGWLTAEAAPFDKPFLHGLFTDHMVLQRDVPCPVWGWTAPGTRVTVSMADKTAAAVAGPDGKWLARIGPFEAGGPYTLTVSGSQTVTLKDVLVGDVWLCSGQSNMEMAITGVNQGYNEVRDANLPNVRLAIVPFSSDYQPPNSVDVPWRVCTPDTVSSNKPIYGGFSAIAFLFGRQINRETNIPVGLIESCLGATAISSWSTPSSLEGLPEYKDFDAFKLYEKNVAESWRLMDPAFETTKEWANPTFNDSNWKTTELPQDWKKQRATDCTGVVWLRREIDIPAGWTGRELVLSFGPIDDKDTVWWNGAFIDSSDTHDWPIPRFYTVPAGLVKGGRTVITIRLIANQGIYGAPEEMYVRTLERESAPVPLAGPWRYCVSTPVAKLDPKKARYPARRDIEASCFQGMIAPLAPFAIKGVIWYQGEGDAGKPSARYHYLLSHLIKDWRALFGVGDFPFAIVQISGFGPFKDQPADSGWAGVREAELQVSQTVPNTGLAVSVDRGEIYNIHPPNKQDVAKRLALVALAQTYGQKNECFGPTYKAMKTEDHAIRLTFDHLAGGLMSLGAGLTGFEIAGADRKFVWANAEIDGETVIVSSSKVPQPVAVRYGWADHPLCNLYNKANLPAPPFRTDSPQ